MRLVRRAVLTLGSASQEDWEFTLTHGDVTVSSHVIGGEASLLILALESSIALSDTPRVGDAGQILLDESVVRQLERGLEVLADLIAVSARARVSLSSALPEVLFADVTPSEIDWLNSTSGTELGEFAISRPIWTVPLDSGLVESLKDRLDGASLLSEALATAQPNGRFRELLRVLERAFALGPFDLIGPVTDFLSYHDVLEYSTDEVSSWLTVLRHLATHADRREEFALSRDILPVLGRVELAAYDVLMNKRDWREPRADRREQWTVPCGVLRDNATLVIVRGQHFRSEMVLLDGFGSYPLNLRLSHRRLQPSLASTWFDRRTVHDQHRAGEVIVVDSLHTDAP